MRTDHLTLSELERLAYIANQAILVRHIHQLQDESDETENACDEAYQTGYEDGVVSSRGYDRGYEEGYEDGLVDGARNAAQDVDSPPPSN